jgi:hypothetical protein
VRTETYQLWDLIIAGAVALGTIALAALAVYQDRIRAWLDAPVLKLSLSNEPPDCIWVPFRHPLTRQFLSDTIHLRFRVRNEGKTTARNVEVYAERLEENRNGRWVQRTSFPPMNLVWADVGGIYFSGISPKMEKHCDLGHVIDPARRDGIPIPDEQNMALNLDANTTSFTYATVAKPFHQGHIVGPGRYRLTVRLATENAKPTTGVVEVELLGRWYPDEARMLRDGIRASVV